MSAPADEHRAFLNQYYGISRWFYDLTRKYYLFGRDRALEQLSQEHWDSLIEMGPGTGRNLRKLSRSKPGAVLGGVEASDAMLEYASKRLPQLKLMQGFAEDADYTNLLGAPPDRVLFSYCLSMVQQPEAALERARPTRRTDSGAAPFVGLHRSLASTGARRGPGPTARLIPCSN